MSVLFNHACRYELFDRNPIYLVRQSAKRRTPPATLVPAEIKALIDGLALRERTLVLLAASTGLRQSEIFGLKWGDIDFERGTMSVIRSIVYGVVGPCKTGIIAKAGANASNSRGRADAVEKTLYLHQARGLGFCKQALSGPKTVLGTGDLAQIYTPSGTTIRHTYSTLLRSVGTEFKVMQELLRHSSFRSTLDVYTQAITPAKHAAQAAVISLVFSSDKDGPALVAG
jgi:integrase